MLLLIAVLGVVLLALFSGAALSPRAWGPWAAGAGVVLLGLVMIIALVGFVRPLGDELAPEDRPASVANPVPRPRQVRRVDVVLTTDEARKRTFAEPAPFVDDLGESGTVLVEVHTGVPVLLQQCGLDPQSHPTTCTPAVPATPGYDGVAVALVEVRARFRGVNCNQAPCAIVAVSEDGPPAVTALAHLIFGHATQRPVLRLDRARSLAAGDVVTAEVTGLQPGAKVTMTWCTLPGPTAPTSCGRPAPALTAVAGTDGRARTRLAVPHTRVGTAGRPCDVSHPCAVAVLGTRLPAMVAPVGFAGVPGADVPGRRAFPALLGAALLLSLAMLVARRRPGTLATADPFTGVSLDVPEWENVSLAVPEWETPPRPER